MFHKFRIAILDGIQNKDKRNLIILITVISFVLSVMMIAPTKLVLAKMLPGKNNDTFTIYATLVEGSSIEQTKRVTDCIVQQVQKKMKLEI